MKKKKGIFFKNKIFLSRNSYFKQYDSKWIYISDFSNISTNNSKYITRFSKYIDRTLIISAIFKYINLPTKNRQWQLIAIH